jgi:hypothetical protein
MTRKTLAMIGGLLAAALSTQAGLVGLWEFDDAGNLGKATIGADLTFLNGQNFSSTAGIAGADGAMLTALGTTNQIIATHGIAPNGGGAYVNRYSVLFDVSYPSSSSGYKALLQTNTGNSNDGDLFIHPDGTVGVGDLGYFGTTSQETWYRIIASFNLGNNPDSYQLFINGTSVGITPNIALDGRFSLDPTVLFFSDEDDENPPVRVSNVALFDAPLSAAEAASLGLAGNTIVPEPGSLILLAFGFAGVWALRRRL